MLFSDLKDQIGSEEVSYLKVFNLERLMSHFIYLLKYQFIYSILGYQKQSKNFLNCLNFIVPKLTQP